MPLKLALGVRDTAAGHRLGALEGGGGGARVNSLLQSIMYSLMPPIGFQCALPNGYGHCMTVHHSHICKWWFLLHILVYCGIHMHLKLQLLI